MVQTCSQQIGKNPENIIPIIQGKNNNNINLAGGLVNDQRASETQIFHD